MAMGISGIKLCYVIHIPTSLKRAGAKDHVLETLVKTGIKKRVHRRAGHRQHGPEPDGKLGKQGNRRSIHANPACGLPAVEWSDRRDHP